MENLKMKNNITNDKVVRFINDCYRPLSIDMENLRKDAESNNVPIILPETEMLLKSLLQISKPKKILEIGTAIGYSALFFAYICENSNIYTIEKSNDMFEQAKKNIFNANKEDKISQYCGDGEEIVKTLNEKDFDFVFIDAAKSHYKRFLDAILPKCKKGAIIVSDNVLFKGKTVSDEYDPNNKYKTSIRNMRQYIDYIFNHSQLETTLNSSGDGVAISIKK